MSMTLCATTKTQPSTCIHAYVMLERRIITGPKKCCLYKSSNLGVQTKGCKAIAKVVYCIARSHIPHFLVLNINHFIVLSTHRALLTKLCLGHTYLPKHSRVIPAMGVCSSTIHLSPCHGDKHITVKRW